MKKAVIYVFSGTGNTRLAADMIAEALSLHGVSVTVREARVPFSSTPDVRTFDIAGFGYPIHAFNTPKFFLSFVETLPYTDGMPAFIFKTSGEPFRVNGASSRPLVRLLRKKGFVPMTDRHLLMPYNIVFRYPDALAKQMYLHTKSMAAVLAGQIADGTKEKLRYNPLAVLWSYLFRVQRFGARLNSRFLRVEKDKCTGCGLCETMCPARNIVMADGYPHFSSKCTMCMSCAFRCPKNAVRPGLLTPLRVNGPYPFEALVKDGGVPAAFVDENTRGYFRLFRPYYRRTDAEIQAYKDKAELHS